eukprot:TRINITY_DN18705_c0_g1_i1.p1 TRINITY_DN18705_c0_g1~~TRINITY_DN18705_c0_g1_i1.p1  ORF type:complete len:306 (+),score=81.69 TRINITY_DN18705_c0_g1_i1:72-920(+)
MPPRRGRPLAAAPAPSPAAGGHPLIAVPLPQGADAADPRPDAAPCSPLSEAEVTSPAALVGDGSLRQRTSVRLPAPPAAEPSKAAPPAAPAGTAARRRPWCRGPAARGFAAACPVLAMAGVLLLLCWVILYTVQRHEVPGQDKLDIGSKDQLEWAAILQHDKNGDHALNTTELRRLLIDHHLRKQLWAERDVPGSPDVASAAYDAAQFARSVAYNESLQSVTLRARARWEAAGMIALLDKDGDQRLSIEELREYNKHAGQQKDVRPPMSQFWTWFKALFWDS